MFLDTAIEITVNEMNMNMNKIAKAIQKADLQCQIDVSMTMADADILDMNVVMHGVNNDINVLQYTQDYGKCTIRLWITDKKEDSENACKIMNDVFGIYSKIYTMADGTVYMYIVLDGVGKWLHFCQTSWSGIYGDFGKKKYHKDNCMFVTVDESSDAELLSKIQHDPPIGWEALKVDW